MTQLPFKHERLREIRRTLWSVLRHGWYGPHEYAPPVPACILQPGTPRWRVRCRAIRALWAAYVPFSGPVWLSQRSSVGTGGFNVIGEVAANGRAYRVHTKFDHGAISACRVDPQPGRRVYWVLRRLAEASKRHPCE